MIADYSPRLRQLDECLLQYAWLWRPQPYKIVRPEWCQRLPSLCAALLQLSDDELAFYSDDVNAALRWLDDYLPGVARLIALSDLPECAANPQQMFDPFLQWDIPGRKWQQIESFVAAIDDVEIPLLEWCGGKGHLGRLSARRFGVEVDTLEHDPALCLAGERLSQRAKVTQRFHVVDVLAPVSAALLHGHHAVALHACGELHRTLLRRAVAQKIAALDFAPCCYHLGFGVDHQPFTATARLQLSADDLRLAVTETVTSAAREVRKRDQEMAWKLGFEQLRRDITGDDCYRPLRPIDKSWLGLDYAGFCNRLAQREGLHFGAVDWASYEAQGWLRQREVMRLSLPRHAVRRALEMWLVLDMADYLQSHGYSVTLATFCQRTVTPRNILVSARLGES